MSSIKTLLLIALAVHVTIIIVESTGKIPFGSILSFKRKCFIKSVPLYKHFALYVGNEFPGDGDIIHHVGKGEGGCIRFGNLKDQGDYQIDNYLEDKKDERIDTSDAAIKQRISAVMFRKEYHLINNNCEHAATYMRYGVSFSKQDGSIAGLGMWCKGEKDCAEWNERLRKIYESTEENQCTFKEKRTNG